MAELVDATDLNPVSKRVRVRFLLSVPNLYHGGIIIMSQQDNGRALISVKLKLVAALAEVLEVKAKNGSFWANDLAGDVGTIQKQLNDVQDLLRDLDRSDR